MSDAIFFCRFMGAFQHGQALMHVYEDPTHPASPPFAVSAQMLERTGAVVNSPYGGHSLFLEAPDPLLAEEIVPGATVFWRDPDDEIASGPVQVVEVIAEEGLTGDSIIHVVNEAGGEAQVLPGELHRWRGPPALAWAEAARQEYAQRVAASAHMASVLVRDEMEIQQGHNESAADYVLRLARIDFDRGEGAQFPRMRREALLDMARALTEPDCASQVDKRVQRPARG